MKSPYYRKFSGWVDLLLMFNITFMLQQRGSCMFNNWHISPRTKDPRSCHICPRVASWSVCSPQTQTQIPKEWKYKYESMNKYKTNIPSHFAPLYVCCPKHCEGNCNDCLLADIDGNEVDVPKSCHVTKNNMCNQRGYDCCVTHIPNDASGYCSSTKQSPCRLGKAF